MENPIKMDDFGGTTIFGNIHIYRGIFLDFTEVQTENDRLEQGISICTCWAFWDDFWDDF